MDVSRYISTRRPVSWFGPRAGHSDLSLPDSRLILVFGLPRSGTTWIGKIFDSHPDTFYRHEPDSWGLLNAVPLLPSADQFGQYRSAIHSFALQLPAMTATKVNASLPIFAKRYYSPFRLHTRRLTASIAKVAARVTGEFPAPSLISGRELAAAPIVWKSIESIGRVGAVLSALPTARAVHIIRHPCGYVASVLNGESTHRFTSRTPSSDDYGIFDMLLHTREGKARGISLPQLKSLSPIERLAWRWVLFNEKAMNDVHGNRRAITVRYEDVCLDPAGKVAEIFDFSRLDWNHQTAAFIAASTSQDRQDYYSVVKDPIKAANKWRTQLSAEDCRRIEQIVRDSGPGRLYFEGSSEGWAAAASDI